MSAMLALFKMRLIIDEGKSCMFASSFSLFNEADDQTRMQKSPSHVTD